MRISNCGINLPRLSENRVISVNSYENRGRADQLLTPNYINSTYLIDPMKR